MGSNKRQNHEWVVVAAREFMKIIRYLGLKSINQASKELHINYRTLKKLDERKPDPTLKLESLFGIWNSLKVFAIVQSPERALEEERLIADSLMCISACFNLSSSVQGIFGDSATDMVGSQSSNR